MRQVSSGAHGLVASGPARTRASLAGHVCLWMLLSACLWVCGAASAASPETASPSSGARPPRGAPSATLAGGTAARSRGAASTARGGTPCETAECFIELGMRAFSLDRFVDAATLLDAGLSIFPPNGKPDQKKAAEDLLARAKSQVGTLRLKIMPANADLSVNGRALGPDQRTVVFVEPGSVTVEAGAESYEAFSRTVTIEKGGTADVEVQLKALPSAGPTASVTTSAAATSVPVSPGPNKVLLGTGIGLTAASIGVGIGLLVASAVTKGDADKLRDELLSDGQRVCAPGSPPAQCKDFTDAGNAAVAMGNAGGALLIAGGVFGAATVIYGVVARPRNEPPPAVKAGFSVGPAGGGLVIHGNF